jgi:hypothetical protein
MTGTVTGQSGKGHRPRIGVLAQGWVRPTLGLAKAHSEILTRLDGTNARVHVKGNYRLTLPFCSLAVTGSSSTSVTPRRVDQM